MKKLFTLLLITVAFGACTKKEENNANKPPQNFTASVTDVKPASAQLNWTEAKDPENQSVTYSVELKGQVLASNLSATGYKLENLIENTAYTGKVVAKDAAGLTTEASFNFSTANSPAPSAFTVSLSKATYKTLDIIWSASTLPDNGTVFYDVYVNKVLRVGSISTQNYIITGLQPQTQYVIKVAAKSAAGKSTESATQLSTTVNQAPGVFTISKSETGVTTAIIEITKPADPEQEALSYFTIIDNTEKQIYPNTGTGSTFTYRVEGLSAATAHTIAIKAKDEGGASTVSNAVNVITYHRPENDFAITPAAEGTKVAIEFITASEQKINTLTSRYYVGNDWKGLSGAVITYTTQPDGKIKIKILIDDAELRTIYNVKFQLNLRWTPEDISTNSLLVNYTHFTPTTAKVSQAIIKGPGTFPPQWTVNFVNCIISDYSSWDIKAIMFGDIDFSTFAGFALCDPSKTGYYTGNATNNQYSYLKTKTAGYVIVKDAGGYHKLNFTYTWQD
ncbi:MAG: fibronectin type III domain-containing protein [Chitinophagaceae bacterium]|nr:fibronectin type III domain-containing protein [Chitinophagaceae bacterium]